jgi:hypothetical protein
MYGKQAYPQLSIIIVSLWNQRPATRITAKYAPFQGHVKF